MCEQVFLYLADICNGCIVGYPFLKCYGLQLDADGDCLVDTLATFGVPVAHRGTTASAVTFSDSELSPLELHEDKMVSGNTPPLQNDSHVQLVACAAASATLQATLAALLKTVEAIAQSRITKFKGEEQPTTTPVSTKIAQCVCEPDMPGFDTECASPQCIRGCHSEQRTVSPPSPTEQVTGLWRHRCEAHKWSTMTDKPEVFPCTKPPYSLEWIYMHIAHGFTPAPPPSCGKCVCHQTQTPCVCHVQVHPPSDRECVLSDAESVPEEDGVLAYPQPPREPGYIIPDSFAGVGAITKHPRGSGWGAQTQNIRPPPLGHLGTDREKKFFKRWGGMRAMLDIQSLPEACEEGAIKTHTRVMARCKYKTESYAVIPKLCAQIEQRAGLTPEVDAFAERYNH